MNDAGIKIATVAKAAKKPSAKARKVRCSVLAKLTPEEFKSLRLNDTSRAELELLSQQFEVSRLDFQTFDGEDISSMASERYEQYSAASAQKLSEGMAIVYFLVPRILKLREGPAKRKWRSDLAKFRKEESLI